MTKTPAEDALIEGQKALWKTDPDAAYAEAERRVAWAWREGAEELDLEGLDALTELPSLTGLTSLKRLSLGDTKVQDPSPLAGLTNLQRLDLHGTPVQDFSPLARLTNLQHLDLQGTPVQDLSPLAGMTNLQNLDLDGTPVQDLSPLAGMTNLQSLLLISTQVQDLSPLAGLTNLQRLYLNSTPVQDLSPLAWLEGLAEGAKEVPLIYGLHFTNTPASANDPTLAALAKKRNPERTIETLAYLRRVQEETPVPGPEAVGAQSTVGLHFGGSPEGPIELVSQAQPKTDTIATTLHAELRREVTALQARCQQSNAQAALSGRLTDYAAALGDDPTQMQAELLVLRGQFLKAARATDEKRAQDPDPDHPALDHAAREQLETLLTAHDYYTATDPALAALVPRLEGPDRPAPAPRSSALVQELKVSIEVKGIATPDAVSAIQETIDLANQAPANIPEAERATILRDETARNFAREALRRVLSGLKGAGIKTLGEVGEVWAAGRPFTAKILLLWAASEAGAIGSILSNPALTKLLETLSRLAS